MQWGIDLLYTTTTNLEGGRAGVIDATPVRHMKRVSLTNLLYKNLGGFEKAYAELHRYLHRLGLNKTAIDRIHNTTGTPEVVPIDHLRAERWLNPYRRQQRSNTPAAADG